MTLDPVAAASHLGVPVSESGQAGETIRPGLVRQRSFCEWAIGSESTYEWEPLLARLLDRLRPLERVRDVALVFDAEVYVSVISEIYGDFSPDRNDFGATTPAHHLSRALLADLATVGASIDIDEYILIDERQDADRPERERLSVWDWGEG
jgi:hypothetical protein